MAIPKSFIAEYLKKAEGCTFFGQKITELTKDELIAMAVLGWEIEAEARAEGISRIIKIRKDIRRL